MSYNGKLSTFVMGIPHRFWENDICDLIKNTPNYACMPMIQHCFCKARDSVLFRLVYNRKNNAVGTDE